MSSIFLPKVVKVGFQNRKDTYTGKLAYLIYYDEANKLRKEKSWENWRDNRIEPIEFENIPTSGFVLNKNVGGYRTTFNYRGEHIRIYDPRNFEFEISISNLLYILENTNSLKGKGLEGEFVYGWLGTELILIPISSPDYQDIVEFTNIKMNNKYISAAELDKGVVYLDRDNNKSIYMGKYDVYHYNGELKGKKHYFFMISDKQNSLYTLKSVSKKFIKKICNFDDCFYDLVETMESNIIYSPIDHSKDIIKEYSYDEFHLALQQDDYGLVVYGRNEDGDIYKCNLFKRDMSYIIRGTYEYGRYDSRYFPYSKTLKFNTIKEVYEFVRPVCIYEYLANGRFFRTKGELNNGA